MNKLSPKSFISQKPASKPPKGEGSKPIQPTTTPMPKTNPPKK